MTSLTSLSSLAASSSSSSSGGTIVGGVLGFIIFVVTLVLIWRSNKSVGTKVLWTVFTFFCNLIALVCWLIFGRKDNARV